MPTTLRTETTDGVRQIVLCRAAEYNTITPALRDALAAAIDEADADHDVHLAPYHYWNDRRLVQPSLIEERPVEAPMGEAVCVVGGAGVGAGAQVQAQSAADGRGSARRARRRRPVVHRHRDAGG